MMKGKEKMDNREAIEAWRARRAKRLEAKNTNHTDTETQEGTWVTIKGTPVLIDNKGNIKNNFKDKGAQKRLGGENMNEVDKGKEKKNPWKNIKDNSKLAKKASEKLDKIFTDDNIGLTEKSKLASNVNKTLERLWDAYRDTRVFKIQEERANEEGQLQDGSALAQVVEKLESLPVGTKIQAGDGEYELVEQNLDGFAYPGWRVNKSGLSDKNAYFGKAGKENNSEDMSDIVLDALIHSGDVKISKLGSGERPRRKEWIGLTKEQEKSMKSKMVDEPEPEHWYINEKGTYSRMR